MSQSNSEKQPLSILEVTGSVLAAGFGVQSKANRVRDFTRGKPEQFAIIGIVFTATFVAGLLTIVNAVLP